MTPATPSRERGIVFTGANVRAIMRGTKRQTRRVLNPQPEPFVIADDGMPCDVKLMQAEGAPWPRVRMGRGGASVLTTQKVHFAVGQRLWVREAHQINAFGSHPNWTAEHVIYAADDACVEMRPPVSFVGKCDIGLRGWRSPIHMPRWASRLTLVVTDVRVQRLQDISCADAIAEGIQPAANSATIDCDTPDPCDGFRDLWNSIHGPAAWDRNPWVAAITFEITPPATIKEPSR